MDREEVFCGIILDDSSVGDYDRRISLLTLERGRISAFLKGAKRSGKNPLSSLTPFCFGEFHIYEGKSSYTVKKAEIKNRFEQVKNDLSSLAYGSYFLDVAKYYSRENADEYERVKLVYTALLALSRQRLKIELIRLIYELKNICIQGEYPNVFECASCKKKEKLKYFSFSKRAIFCTDCCDDEKGCFALGPSVLKALTYIFITPCEKLFSFDLSDKAFSELRSFANRYISAYFPHNFKTLEFLDILTI